MNIVVQKLADIVWTTLEPILLAAGKQLVQDVLDELQRMLDSHPGPPSPL